MAIYHASFKILSRSQGRSSVQFSSYIAGVKLFDNRLGISFDHTSKEEIIYSEISLPAHAKKEWNERSILWNEVESFEKNKNAQVARTFEIAIPVEWSQQEAKERCKEYVISSLVERGMCVDWAIHWKDGNPHLQGLATLRQIDDEGNWKACKQKKVYELDEKGEKIPIIDKKTCVQKVDNRNRKQWKRITVEDNTWNHRGTLKQWRKEWAALANKYLTEENKIDERSYQEQEIDRIPTQKEGYVARKMEERGLISERCERNREIKAINIELAELNKEIEVSKILLTHSDQVANTNPISAEPVNNEDNLFDEKYREYFTNRNFAQEKKEYKKVQKELYVWKYKEIDYNQGKHGLDPFKKQLKEIQYKIQILTIKLEKIAQRLVKKFKRYFESDLFKKYHSDVSKVNADDKEKRHEFISGQMENRIKDSSKHYLSNLVTMDNNKRKRLPKDLNKKNTKEIR